MKSFITASFLVLAALTFDVALAQKADAGLTNSVVTPGAGIEELVAPRELIESPRAA